MKRVLITGATGFVGRRLAHHLLDEGYELKALTRTPDDAADLAERGAELIEGSLANSMAIHRALSDVDGIFHLAATHQFGGDMGPMRRINVQGTRNVLQTADYAEVSRILYCGSDTSLGDTKGKICDESKEHDGDFRSVYERTVFETHELIERQIDKGAPIINAIVSMPYGPGDTSAIADLISHHLAGRAVAHLDRHSGFTFTHVDDIATALRIAYEKGDVGERYLVSGTPASSGEFFATLSELTNIPEPRTDLPDWLVDLMEPLAERLAPAVGKSGAQIREALAVGRGTTRYYSGQKMRDEFGWQPRSLEDGLRDSLPWFRQREAEASERLLSSTSIPLVGMSLFDIGLGTSALVFPETYLQLMHPHASGTHPPAARSFLARTGLLWLFFAFVQGRAGAAPVDNPEWVLVAGALRLMDVPADIGYLLSSEDLGLLGKAGLIAAPLFNLGIGAFLTYAGYRGLRAKLSS